MRKNGIRLASRIKDLFEGKHIKDIIPQSSEVVDQKTSPKVYADEEIMAKFGIILK